MERVKHAGKAGPATSGPIRWLIAARDPEMPSLLRFLTVVGIIAGIGYGVVFALANFVNPKPREITVSIPPDRFLKR